MAIGINSRVDLSATTYTTIATTPASGKAQLLTVSLTNRSGSTGTFRLAVVNNGTTTPAAGDFIEYNATLATGTAFERTGIVLQNGQTLVAYSSVASVSAVTYGLEDNAVSATGAFKFAPSATTWTQVSAGPTSGRYQTVTLSICNPNTALTLVRVCISTAYNSPNASDYIEYDSILPGGAVLERSGIVLGNGQQLGVYVSTSGISVVGMIVDDQ
jgi:hypothetical protein